MADDFELELKKTFLEEASSLLEEVEQCFLDLEKNPGEASLLEKIFRLAHNLKGSSKAVGFGELGAFTHEFESFLLKVKTGKIPATAATVSLMLRCNDHVREIVKGLSLDFDARFNSTALTHELLNFESAAAAPIPEPEPEPAASETLEPDPFAANEWVDVSAPTEFVAPAPASVPMPNPVAPQSVEAGAAETRAPEGAKGPAVEESIRVSVGRVEALINYVGEMVILQTVLREQSLGGNADLVRRTVHQLGRVGKEIQDIAMGLRMVPVKQTFQKMQRIVRDTAGLLNKKVQLALEGEETELDKTVLERIGDPLVHLMRNAVDHGLELPEERLRLGKPEAGQVKLRALQQSGKLIIEVIDDGKGIDPDRLVRKAIEKGVLPPNAQLTRAQAIDLIFHPGFSTAAQLSEVSGRGVGMDVVRTNIKALQGDIQVTTELGKGTTFRIALPLSLSIIDGLVVTSGPNRYVVPLSQVHESVRLQGNTLLTRAGVGEIFLLRGENLPVYRLAKVLAFHAIANAPAAASGEQIALVVRTLGSPFALLVDDIIGQQQVVIKKLGLELQHVGGVAGSAILGDGKPALIIEPGDLITRHEQGAGSARAPSAPRRMAA